MAFNNFKLYFSITAFSFCLFSFAQESKYKDTIIAGQLVKLNLETGAIKFISSKVSSKAKNVESTTEVLKTPKNNDSDFYSVSKNETFIDIAYRFNISVLELKKLNNLENYNLEPGQKLRVKKNNASNIAKVTPSISNDSIHIVKQGETLYSISTKNNMTVEKLKELNNLSSNTIKIGQILQLKK